MFTLVLMLLTLTDAAYIISLYGDVYKDVDFFTRTFPWIIDNIGGEISVDYFLQGSGRYSVPHMCALNELKLNTFLQAQYLKCEAEGKPSEDCLCEVGIDPQKYKYCVLTKGSYASLSASKYHQLSIDASPIIELGYRNTVFGVEDSWYLKKICTIFGDNQPRGCKKPFACNSTESHSERRGVVNFNCPECYNLNMNLKEYQDHSDVTTATTPAYTPTTTLFYD